VYNPFAYNTYAYLRWKRIPDLPRCTSHLALEKPNLHKQYRPIFPILSLSQEVDMHTEVLNLRGFSKLDVPFQLSRGYKKIRRAIKTERAKTTETTATIPSSRDSICGYSLC
jgi:hypothetical protein